MWANERAFDVQVAAASRRHGVPAWVILATIAKESSFNPRSQRRESGGRVSRGLMQLLGSTAIEMGYTGPAGDDATRTGGLYDPATSIEYGTAYLAHQSRRYPADGWDAIYAAYNSGAVRRSSSGTFVTAGGDPVVESHVAGWRRAADHFNPGWAGPPQTAPRRPSTAGLGVTLTVFLILGWLVGQLLEGMRR